MKLAAIYNCWDADYLLPYSIMSIRASVQKVIVVYQNQSNYGELYSPDLTSHLIDHAIHFTPNLSLSGAENERRKRNIGLDKAKSLGCTHFIMMDNDECYDPQEFKFYKEEALKYDSTACRLYTYYHSPNIRLTPLEDYYVPFIHKIYKETQIGATGYPVRVDPTRTVNTFGNFHLFDFPLMHHYSWVRKDIGQKLRNSSAVRAFDGRMKQLVDGFNNFNVSREMVFYDQYGYEIVENKFGIEI